MNYELNEDQAGILAGLDQLLAAHAGAPSGEPENYVYGAALDAALAESDFLDIARIDGFGPLDAALVVERLARLPQVVEAGPSALISPLLSLEQGERPLALVSGDATRPARFLPMARHLLVLRDEDALLISLDGASIEPVESLMAYPYGKLASIDRLSVRTLSNAGDIRRRWRIAIAVEASGCMAAALATVIEHVRTRQAFGRPLGAFQAIQHRLAMAEETAQSARWLAFRAAWSDGEADAAIAAGFVQDRVARFTYDLHQFSGAMGLTLEFPLHLWTYRLRALAGELGGASAQARAAARAVWGVA
jgi:hypothetical protein